MFYAHLFLQYEFENQENDFSCSACSKSFNKKSYLSNHLKRSKNCRLSQKPTKPTKPATTSNETVFECTACNNTFKSNKAFLKHCKFTCKNKSGEVKEFKRFFFFYINIFCLIFVVYDYDYSQILFIYFFSVKPGLINAAHQKQLLHVS